MFEDISVSTHSTQSSSKVGKANTEHFTKKDEGTKLLNFKKSTEEVTLEITDEPTLTKEEIEDYVNQIKEAMDGFFTDKGTIKDIILNEDLNSYDIFEIMKTYQEQEKSFIVQDMTKRFFGNDEKALLNRFAEVLMELMDSDDAYISGKASQILRSDPGFDKIKVDTGNIVVSNMAAGIRG